MQIILLVIDIEFETFRIKKKKLYLLVLFISYTFGFL